MGIVNQQPITSIKIGDQTQYGGSIEISAPGATIDPDTGAINFPPAAGATKSFTIVAEDLTNKYLLVDTDITTDESTKVEVAQLAPQFHGIDFVVDGTNKKKIKWNGLGLDGLLEVGDQGLITYF
jgi:hypothetical protein